MDRALYGARWAGPLLGLLALVTGLAVAELVTGLVVGAPSPVVAVGQSVIDVAPPALKDWAIATFGTSNKTALVSGTLIVLAALGMAVGALAARGERATALLLSGLVGVIGVFAVLTRPTTSSTDVLPTVLGTLVTMGVLWAIPIVLAHPRVAEPDEPAAVTMGLNRRGLLAGAAGLGTASVLVGGIGRWMQRGHEISAERATVVLPEPSSPAPALPPSVDVGVDGVGPFVTPTSRFFRIDTALTVPQVSRDDWRLRIHGDVEREIELDYDDLLRRPQVERHITLSCVSNPVGGDLIGTARWQGVLLADVLREARPLAGADQIVSRSVDGWTCGTPTSVVMDGRDALLAVAMNGEPLPARHGYPVRMVVPGLFGYVSATKWVTDIELTAWDAFDAYWVPRGWSKEGPVKTMARIEHPRSSQRQAPGVVDIAGTAWAIHRGIEAVQVRVDGGDWLDCELGAVPSDDTWRQWRLRWDATPGDHVVEARAIDGQGVPQPDQPRPVAPDGAQGYHRVRLVVNAA
jgi:DMSO/TMAO reductase YedYZ molybdopterin-dependent catalytic subunit